MVYTFSGLGCKFYGAAAYTPRGQRGQREDGGNRGPGTSVPKGHKPGTLETSVAKSSEKTCGSWDLLVKRTDQSLNHFGAESQSNNAKLFLPACCVI